MTLDIIVPVFFIMSGICAYAFLNHLFIGLRKPYNLLHLLFSGLCILVTFFGFFHTLILHSHSVIELVPLLRTSLAFVILFMLIFPWFIAEYTGVRPRYVSAGFSVSFAALFVANLFLPYTLQYQEINNLYELQLFWGETVTRIHGTNGLPFKLAALNVVLLLAFSIYALWKSYRQYRQRTTLLMLFAIFIFSISTIEGILARLSVINFVESGPFAYLSMLIVMSMVLSYETRRSGMQLQSILDHVPAAVYTKDTHGRYLMINRHLEQLFHVETRQALGKTDYDFLPHNQADIFRKNDLAVLKSGKYIEEEEIADLGGVPHTFLSIKFPLFNFEGKPTSVCGISTDITEKKRMDEALRQISSGVSGATGKDFFNQLVRNLSELFVVDYALVGVLDMHNSEQISTLAVYGQGHVMDNFSYALKGTPCESVLQQETCVYPQDVRTLFPEDSILADMNISGYIGTPLFNSERKPLGIIVLLHGKPLQHTAQMKNIIDIFAARTTAELERMRSDALIHRMAYQDFLTELPNRASLYEQLNELLQVARHTASYSALLLIDLDHFKTINDALGHDVGDDVLRAIGQRLINIAKNGAFIARIGGDEFVALIKTPCESYQVMTEQAEALSQRILESMVSPMMIGERLLSIGASIGVALFPKNTDESELDVLRHADMALYRAKTLGRNNMQFYMSSLQSGADYRMALEDGLRNAIENHELELNFQPLVNAAGKMIGAETLLRWHNAELGTVSPTIFIPIAEETGLIHRIGLWVFDHACRNFTAWQHAAIPYQGYLSINICPWQFARPDFIQQLRKSLQDHKIDPARLMLEITESALLYDLKEAIEKLTELRKMGLRIALDDFGTGYSSLSYLKDLPLDLIKIDIAFVRELNTNPEHPLVETILAMGRHMKLSVIAEGVENITQHDILQRMGCDGYQGFLFSKPLVEKEFLQWVAQNQK